ncbi:hypothetical protein F4859DRAFT_362671 [Xylaria cf. heliscus]|nr:hypothetical protein F4859DRAFT_362671 [Xylaria cf. heliscus]
MAVSSSSQCYQAVYHRLRPHYHSIWVPDSLLASAFERHVALSRAGARYGSSVPGPMEHRKRLSRRNMGELHFGQSHSAAPIWELASMVDLTQWQWKPPTLPNRRSRPNTNTTTTEVRPPSDAMLSPMPSFFPQGAGPADDPPIRDEMLLPKHAILRGVAEPLPSTASDVGSTPLDVINAALESLSRDMANSTEDSSLFSGFCEGWRKALADGLFRAEAIGQVLTGISDGLNIQSIHTSNSRTADRLKLVLLEATIEGISRGETRQATSFDRVAWASILDAVSTIQMNTIRIFGKAIACIPQQSLKEVLPGILRNLDAFFNALGRVNSRQTVLRQAAKMAVPLKSLGQPELSFILDEATQMVLGYARVDGVTYEHIRLSWLLLFARMPGVHEERLAQACNTLEADMVDLSLKEIEICHIFIVWAASQAPFEYHGMIRTFLKIGSHCYRLLALRLWETNQYYRIRQFSKFLQLVGRENKLFLISNFRRYGPSSLASIAIGMRRPQAAIDILCLCEESRRRKSSFWESPLGFKALEILTWVPNFNHRMLWSALAIPQDNEIRARYPRRVLPGLHEHKISTIAAVGVVAALSPHLSQRKAFALLTNCYLNLKRHNAKLPRAFLHGLVHNITRPLAEGQPGISSRIEYLLYIIQHQLGVAEARQVAMVMERRRKANFELTK